MKILLDPYPRTLDLIFSAAERKRLEALGDVLWHEGAPLAGEVVEEHLPETVAIIGQTALDKARLSRAPNLRLVANVEGNFLPNIDYAVTHARNIPVVSTAPVFAQAVAELALGHAIALARRVVEADTAVRQGKEALYGEGENQDLFLLHQKTFGLIGFGNLGRALLPLIRPFSRHILAYDPWIHAHVLQAEGLEPTPLDDLFTRAQVVFILAAATTENQESIGKSYFDKMQTGALVILISRAGVVNFEALLDAAAAGKVRAAIDVFPEEPIPQDHRARRTPNTLLSAHRAGNVPEIWRGMGEMVVDDLELVLRGLPPQRCQQATLATVEKMRSKPVG